MSARAPGPTPSQTVGPFFSAALLRAPLGSDLVAPGTPGALRIEGTVLDGAGAPVPDAMVEIWQADAAGRYASGGTAFTGFGRSGTDEEGHFHFLTVKPGRVAHPDGGLQAPHLCVGVFARGLLKRLVTRCYFPDEQEANATDPVLSGLDPEERGTLVARPSARGVVFDVRLQGPGQTVFFAL